MRPLHGVLALLVVVGSSFGVVRAGSADGVAAKDPRNFTWVEEGVLAIGGGGLNASEVDWLHEAGFRAIADLRAEHQDPAAHIAAKGMSFFDLPVDSASHINETMLAGFVEWAREQRAAGRPVYVHCTNGWHRAAAFAVAWEMAEHGEGYDEAAREAAARRPGTVMRAVSGLLDYEATLRGLPQATVVLVSPISRPEPNATMAVHVDVVAGGAPAVGATVRVWSEESRLRIEGTTDANGRFTFTYTAPSQAFMDHLYARAHVDGFVDGADNVEFLFAQPAKARGPLEVVATREGDDLLVRATAQGKPVPVRVVATSPGWSAFESSDRGALRIAGAPREALSVRVVSWGSEGGVANVEAPALPPPPPPAEPSPVDPAPAEPPAPEPPVVAQPPGPSQPPIVSEPPALAEEPLEPWGWDDFAKAYARAAAKRLGSEGVAYVGVALVSLACLGGFGAYVLVSRRRAPS